MKKTWDNHGFAQRIAKIAQRIAPGQPPAIAIASIETIAANSCYCSALLACRVR